jgi:predicted DNA-binding protein with PD1-like motif
MKSKTTESGHILTLERGERLIGSLTEYCAQAGIESGFFVGLGAVRNTQIGYYDLSKKEYFFKDFPEDREVASMTGNVALVDGKPFIHAHAILSASDDSLSCVGGHIKECEVAVTLEIFLTKSQGPISRVLDEAIGLKLIAL